jgi:cytochrome d ubiquinol oxidase subunit I
VAPNPTGDPSIRLKTQTAVSPYLDTPSVAISLVVFTLLYGVLAVVWYQLMHRYTLEGAPQVTVSTSHGHDGHDGHDGRDGQDGGRDGQDGEDAPLAFAY